MTISEEKEPFFTRYNLSIWGLVTLTAFSLTIIINLIVSQKMPTSNEIILRTFTGFIFGGALAVYWGIVTRL